MEFEKEGTRLHYLEDSLGKRLWNSRKRDYGMNEAFYGELINKNILFGNPKMFQSYSQNPNTRYYVET